MLIVTGVQAQEQYRSYAEAYSAGAKLTNQRKLSEARAPLEAALKLAPDDKSKLSVYHLLSRVYRELPEIDKKMEADEFVVRHSDRRAARSLPARDLASFLYQRGKLDEGIERYEGVLKENPDDVAALAVLAIIYDRPKPDPKRAAEVNERLEQVNRQIARKHAERLENEAGAAPQTTASLLKDAAQFWLEAGDKPKARAAARRSADSPAEARSEILTFYWRDGLGDVFLATAEPQLAVEQYEAALKATSIELIKRNTEKKLAEAKQAALIKTETDK
jgi:tetratricopeptide (TPR) repeat protein